MFTCVISNLKEEYFLKKYLNFYVMVQWPSGLRRLTQVQVSSEAWVQIPLEPFFFNKKLVTEPIFKFGNVLFQLLFDKCI